MNSFSHAAVARGRRSTTATTHHQDGGVHRIHRGVNYLKGDRNCLQRHWNWMSRFQKLTGWCLRPLIRSWLTASPCSTTKIMKAKEKQSMGDSDLLKTIFLGLDPTPDIIVSLIFTSWRGRWGWRISCRHSSLRMSFILVPPKCLWQWKFWRCRGRSSHCMDISAMGSPLRVVD